MADQPPQRDEELTRTSAGPLPPTPRPNVPAGSTPKSAPKPSPQPQPQPAPAAPTNASGVAPGQRVGKYRIVRVLGRGGMGTVFEALDTVLARKVALKLLPDELVHNDIALKRFIREARAAAQLNHPNTVAVYDVARKDAIVYITMELIEGSSAQALVDARRSLDPREATRIIADTCRGLVAAHKVGLIHRDIKPNNLFLAQNGSVKLGDFGLAKITSSQDVAITRENALLGTPLFMSPEQCLGEPADARSDIYSLAATYFALLTGRPPYDSSVVVKILHAHVHDPVPDPRDFAPEIPDACAQVILKAMAKKPAERYQSAQEMLADLDAIFSASDPGVRTFNDVLSQIEPAGPMTVAASTATSLPRRSVNGTGGIPSAWMIGGGVALLLLAIAIFWVVAGSGRPAVTEEDEISSHRSVTRTEEATGTRGGTTPSSPSNSAGPATPAKPASITPKTTPPSPVTNAAPERSATSLSPTNSPAAPAAGKPESGSLAMSPANSTPAPGPSKTPPAAPAAVAKAEPPREMPAEPPANMPADPEFDPPIPPPPPGITSAEMPTSAEARNPVMRHWLEMLKALGEAHRSGKFSEVERQFSDMEKFARKYKDSDQPISRKAGMLANKMAEEFRRRSAGRPGQGPPNQGPPPRR